MAKNKGGNRPGEDGPYRPPNPSDAPPYPPKPTKLAKKNKKSGGIYGKSDKKYEEDYDTNDHQYGLTAKKIWREGDTSDRVV